MHPLEHFRIENKLTYQALADLIQVKNATTARNYCLGLSMPEPAAMRRIAQATAFAVTADHFYGIDRTAGKVTPPGGTPLSNQTGGTSEADQTGEAEHAAA